MRIDKFLNAVNITKRRAVAEDMLNENVVFLNNIAVKKSKDVKIDDIIKLQYLEYSDEFRVLQIPTTKSTPKGRMCEYVEKIGGKNVSEC
ncbi:MAG: RNA-binding S4 domain-containing protein [Arcobacteraceae bacterium]